MIYVYARHIDSGREDLSGIYSTWNQAIERITSLYIMDANMTASKGQYYYFAKER